MIACRDGSEGFELWGIVDLRSCDLEVTLFCIDGSVERNGINADILGGREGRWTGSREARTRLESLAR